MHKVIAPKLMKLKCFSCCNRFKNAHHYFNACIVSHNLLQLVSSSFAEVDWKGNDGLLNVFVINLCGVSKAGN